MKAHFQIIKNLFKNTKSNKFFVDYFPQKHFQRCQLKFDVFFEVKEDILMKNVLFVLLYCNVYYVTKILMRVN